jgi:zinc transporter, ZIP family
MNQPTTVLLGAIAGFTIFIGLPVARLRGLSRATTGFLNALATGILIFLLWDVLSKANEPVAAALDGVHHGQAGAFLGLAGVFAAGIAIGLLSLISFNQWLGARLRRPTGSRLHGPGAAVAMEASAVPSGRWLAMMIAVGLGLHNLSEGLAIGEASVRGAISFAAILIIGFGLHNITEGFGIAAPMASDDQRPTWSFLLLAGLVGGAPTFLGTIVGYSVSNTYFFVLFLALAAGALVYIISEMFNVGRKFNTPSRLGWGVLLGFLAGYGTDLLLTFAGS